MPEREPKPELPPVIRHLLAWRKRNGLSRRAALEVLASLGGYTIPLPTLEKWERGEREPSAMTLQALEAFLRDHAVIANPPVYRPGPKPGLRKRPPR
jgi:transcriptional regulator with XRE-family HTH domain